MKRLQRLTLLLLLMGLLISLSATIITKTFGGVACNSSVAASECSAAPGAATIAFDNLYGNITGSNSFTSGIATFSWTAGTGDPIVQESKLGAYAAPGQAANPTPYLSVGSPDGPAVVTIDLSSPITYFGMYIGSPDRYNSITFYSMGTAIDTYSGLDFLETLDDNVDLSSEGLWETANYVNFSITEGTVDRIVMSSNSPAFEMDNLAVATPEPTSLVTFCIGVVLLVGGRRLKRR